MSWRETAQKRRPVWRLYWKINIWCRNFFFFCIIRLLTSKIYINQLVIMYSNIKCTVTTLINQNVTILINYNTFILQEIEIGDCIYVKSKPHTVVNLRYCVLGMNRSQPLLNVHPPMHPKHLLAKQSPKQHYSWGSW